MAGKYIRSVIKKGLQSYAVLNLEAEQRVATSIAHQVRQLCDALQALTLHALMPVRR